MRYDLSFFLCCCKAFLGNNDNDERWGGGGGVGEEYLNFYQILGIERDASPDEIKRAYKRKSLQMHPDKLAQRGESATAETQARFTRMMEAYECLSDPHKRETYNAIGEKGMKWLDEPMSMNPQELAENFTKASILDRSKIFAIFVAIAVVVLALPVVVCLHVDGVFGNDASWMATLVPLWIGNLFVLFYHSRVIMMPNLQKPDNVLPEEWVDPFPMNQRIFSLARFLLVLSFELLVALKLDDILEWKWAVVFTPLFLWESTILYKKWPLARLRIITIEELETELERSFLDLMPEEKVSIGKKYSVVSSTSGPDFQAAHKLRARARQDLTKSLYRSLFVIVLVIQIDTTVDLNWWLIFLPFWIMTFFICVANYKAFAEVQVMAAEKDPGLFGLSSQDENNENDAEMGTGMSSNETTTNIAIGAGNNGAAGSNTDYGSVGGDGAATPEAASASTLPRPELSEEEKERLKEQVINSSSTLCTQCCSQGFVLILVCLIVGKLQGAGFSLLWLISPFLFAVSCSMRIFLLCCFAEHCNIYLYNIYR
jgi:hypothetical protein